jgi:hypothetical protein
MGRLDVSWTSLGITTSTDMTVSNEKYEEDEDADGSEEYDSDDASELPPTSLIDTTNSVSENFGDKETEFEDDEDEEDDKEGGGQEDEDEETDGEDDDGEDENEDEDDDENDDNGNDEYEAEEEDQSTLDSENINDSDADDDNDENDFKDEDDGSDDDFKDEGGEGDNDDDDDDDDDDDSNDESDDSDTNDSDDEDEDSGHQDFEDLQLDSFLLGGAEGLDLDSDNDDFPDEFDPWSRAAAETSPSEMRNGTKQREQRGRGRIGKMTLPKGRSSRLFLLVVIAVLGIGAFVLILYFAGVGPFGAEEATSAAEKTKPPTKPPSPPSSAPTITASPSAFDPDALEIEVKPNYQAIVPSGIANNVTIQSLSLDLISLMDALAPDVLGALEAIGEKRMLRERRRNLQSYSVKLPTSIDEIYEIGEFFLFSFHVTSMRDSC